MTMSAAHAPPNTDVPHQHALTLAGLGLRVLPIKPGYKHPPMASWQHAATNEWPKIDNWFKGLYRECGLGLALGPQPGGRYLFAIDIDTHDPTVNGWEELADLEFRNSTLPETWRSLTGAGGGHLIFAAPPGVIVRNQQASGNRIAPGIDVRGDGGQIVVAPTIHPDTGRAYAWEIGYAPWERDVAAAPDWLIDLVREPDLFADPPAPRIDLLASTNGDSIAESVREWWDWHHELEARGWTLCRTSGADSYWARPGKTKREGHSAVLHGDTHLVVFTTGIPDAWRHAGVRTVDGSGYSFSPFGFIAAVDHHGDRREAARALRLAQQRHPAATPPITPGPSTADPETDDDTREDDWSKRDLATIARQILAGNYELERPQLLEVDGGMPLLYPGRVHSIFGPPGGGKTWVALRAIAERLKLDEHVLMIDWEDAEQGTTQRLLQLGCTPEQLERLDYRNPTTSLAYGWSTLVDDPTPWTLVVIDSAGEALAAQGIELADDTGTAQWMQLAKRLARRPDLPVVLMLDHVPKANDEPARYAIGSQRKLAAITGAAYRCDTLIEPARGKDGKLRLVTAKDRLGNRAKGSTAAEVHLHDVDELLDITLTMSAAQQAAERGEKFRPTILMEKVSKWLEFHPGASRRTIEKEVSGNTEAKRSAIDVLIEEGYIVVSKVGQTHEHTIAKPYSEAFDDLLRLVDNSATAQPRPTAPNRAQTVAPGAAELTAPTAPPSVYQDGAVGAGRDLWDTLDAPIEEPPVDKPKRPKPDPDEEF